MTTEETTIGQSVKQKLNEVIDLLADLDANEVSELVDDPNFAITIINARDTLDALDDDEWE